MDTNQIPTNLYEDVAKRYPVNEIIAHLDKRASALRFTVEHDMIGADEFNLATMGYVLADVVSLLDEISALNDKVNPSAPTTV